jgi:predicted nucleotidyltransferase
MILRREIKKWCATVAREFRPEQIIVFGSYAIGTPTIDSDVDVLVVISLARGHRDVEQAAAIRERVPAPFPMDVIVRSPQEIARRLSLGDGFIASVMRDGQSLPFIARIQPHRICTGISLANRKKRTNAPEWKSA